jgi:two-component system, chemotaxis family, response regulator WspF
VKIAIISPRPEVIARLRQMLALRPVHELLGLASETGPAVELCTRRRPELVLVDLALAGTGGLAAIDALMRHAPCAILVLADNVGMDSARVFDAMGRGAIDATDTPFPGAHEPASTARFLKKIDTIATLVATPRYIPGAYGSGDTISIRRKDRLIAIGASAGGPSALTTLLAGLPSDLPATIVIVQHVDEQFAKGMAAWLGKDSPLPVRIACEGDDLVPGTVLLAATNEHLTFKAKDRIGYTPEPRDYMYRPSIDVFFKSICDWWPGDAVGVLLTGMGCDGAQGLKTLRSQGHYTIAQDQTTSAVFGMPKAAAALGAAVDVLPIERMAARLVDTFGHKP